jgi:hypothetical protein
MTVGAGGQLLERSIVDRMVAAPERVVFEAAPTLRAPIAQDEEARRPQVFEGPPLDSCAACPSLSVVERALLGQLQARERQRLTVEVRKSREAFILEHAQRLAERTGMAMGRASRLIAKQCNGVLLPSVILPFDDDDLAGCTVGDVLADPARFEDATLADPREGVAYGACKARIMRDANGTPWIHSFAHGQKIYELKLDAEAATVAVESVPKEQVAVTFVRVVLAGALDDAEVEELRNLAAKRAQIGIRILNRMLKDERARQTVRRAQEENERRAAARTDPRPQIQVPMRDGRGYRQLRRSTMCSVAQRSLSHQCATSTG